ncbi:MAG TPA: hypothetical protein VKQ08_02160 [Cyclobacteriaceae bacterium]|nr:hypothetical protein [Cyclobacteriaceae bacterium]
MSIEDTQISTERLPADAEKARMRDSAEVKRPHARIAEELL